MPVTSRLTGFYFIRPTASACKRAWTLCDHDQRHYQKLRRHGLNLRWLSGPSADEQGPAGDLDWDWIKGLPGLHIGELRIDEHINGHENLRIVFFRSEILRPTDPGDMRVIWLLDVFPKKRQDFSKYQLQTFAAKRKIILHREYDAIAGV